jgi:ribosomal protein S18 acetylase RimI-like enzyme
MSDMPPLSLRARDGTQFTAQLTRHQSVCWRYLIYVGGECIGDLLFEPEDKTTMKLHDIKVAPEYRGRGIALALLSHLLREWKAQGYTSLIGIVVAHDPEFKEKLVSWYERLGARVVREAHDWEPRYAGKLHLAL